MLDFVVSNNFNGLRIPFSLDTVLNYQNRYPYGIDFGVNPDLSNKNSLEVLDVIFSAASSRGILILLDLHAFDPNEPEAPVLWYTDPAVGCVTNPDGVCVTYTIQHSYDAWTILINRYQSYWNFWGVDLLNEPHSWVRWGNNNPNSDWAIGAAEIGNYIISNFPNWHGLILVEGIELNPQCEILGFPGCETCTNDGHWWGGNMEGVRCATVALSDQNRLVYSPHVYGTSVYNQAYFSNASFPDNLEYIYDTHFGFVTPQTGRATVIGEWGGYYTGTDKIIQDYQASYFSRKGINGFFYWALNPNPTGDTDGLLNPDWLTINTDKANFLATAFPTHTVFTLSGDQICFTTDETTTTAAPTVAPTTPPTQAPTQAPTKAPTPAPTQAPTKAPTQPPTQAPSNGCSGTVAVNQRSSTYTSNGVVYYTYDVTLLNTGSSVITAATAVISYTGSIDQTWNYDFSTNILSGFGSYLDPAYSFGGAGFILVGGASASVSSASVQCGSQTSTSTSAPTSSPTTAPTSAPTSAPTPAPTKAPTPAPTPAPTKAPTSPPTTAPTSAPTIAPTTPPSNSACAASVTATVRSGASSDSALWDLKLTNTGTNPISSLTIYLVPASGTFIDQYWNMEQTSGNIYSVDFYSNLNNKGATYIGVGFEVMGGISSPTVSINSVSC